MEKTSAATLLSFCISLLVAGCASPTPPRQEPVNLIFQPDAVVKDSMYEIGRSSAVFCVALSVDGVDVDNSIGESIQASAGQGNVLLVRRIDRRLAPGVHKVGIGCRTTSPLPIIDMFNKFKVRGVVEFKAVRERTYVVRGKFEGELATAWIEDEGTGEPVTASAMGSP